MKLLFRGAYLVGKTMKKIIITEAEQWLPLLRRMEVGIGGYWALGILIMFYFLNKISN